MEWQGVTAHRKGNYRVGRYPGRKDYKMKYKIGDRVRYLGCNFTVQRGEMGVVKGFMPHSNIIAIELDHEVSFHDCDGLTRFRRGWWVNPDNIELIKPAEHEFKLIIVSKDDTTTAKLLHGKTIEKEATVTRYHEDEYSEKAAVEAVVKKLFGEEEKEKNTDKPYNGKAVWIAENEGVYTKGKIYEFVDGKVKHDLGFTVGGFTIENMKQTSCFLPIVE